MQWKQPVLYYTEIVCFIYFLMIDNNDAYTYAMFTLNRRNLSR